jgi:hypothetical protein
MQGVTLALHHALGFAGRTRRVDDIGERVGRNVDIRIVIRPRRQCVDIDHARLTRRESLRHRQVARVGHDDTGLRIFDDVGVTAFRESRIDRNVGMPGLENADDGGNAGGTVLDAHNHPLGRPAGQCVGEPIGEPVQLLIGQ